jgi:hypothetical protein
VFTCFEQSVEIVVNSDWVQCWDYNWGVRAISWYNILRDSLKPVNPLLLFR